MHLPDDLSRRRILGGTAAAIIAALARPSVAWCAEEPLRTRAIPHSGEQLPVVGIGSAIIFDFDK
jgi:hypothetical protein